MFSLHQRQEATRNEAGERDGTKKFCPEGRRFMAGSPIPVAGLEIFLPDKLHDFYRIFDANSANASID